MTTPSGSRDLRVRAYELKFLVNRDTGQRIREAARAWLPPDPYASGAGSDQYLTTTLYFDTGEFAVYQRQGSYRRAKYRIRRYGHGPIAFLERKLRTADVLSKRRTSVFVEELPRLTTDSLDDNWPGLWFQERLLMRRLAPVCQVTYLRTARVGVTDYGPIRLTLDDDLIGMPIESPAFQPATDAVPLLDRTIVEFKFTAVMPAGFKKIAEEFSLEPVRISKYRLGVEATRRPGAMANA